MRLPIEFVPTNDFFVGLASMEKTMSEKIEIDRDDFEWLVDKAESYIESMILESWGFPTQEEVDRIKRLASLVGKDIQGIIITKEQNDIWLESFRKEKVKNHK
ncbi:hypothetical protein M0R72_18170 [Candidatus Pacearchaeota archaeon]|jgi:hypothetical protein|nr:hypothetical protein [Candidatus Pacearchaeota archaeon]